MSFKFIIGDEGRLSIEATLLDEEQANRFAMAFNAAREIAFPSWAAEEPGEEEAETDDAAGVAPVAAHEPSRRRAPDRLNVMPGTRAHDVLSLLQTGVVDPVEIADRLDMKTNVAASFKARLIAGGHWAATGDIVSTGEPT